MSILLYAIFTVIIGIILYVFFRYFGSEARK